MKKLSDHKLSRRKLLGGAAASTAALPVLHELIPHHGLHGAQAADARERHEHDRAVHRGSGHRGAVGRVDPRVNGFDPSEILRDFDEGTLRRVGGRTGASR